MYESGHRASLHQWPRATIICASRKRAISTARNQFVYFICPIVCIHSSLRCDLHNSCVGNDKMDHRTPHWDGCRFKRMRNALWIWLRFVNPSIHQWSAHVSFQYIDFFAPPPPASPFQLNSYVYSFRMVIVIIYYNLIQFHIECKRLHTFALQIAINLSDSLMPSLHKCVYSRTPHSATQYVRAHSDSVCGNHLVRRWKGDL